MPLTTAGLNFIAKAIINEGTPTFFTSAANAHLGVGDSTTAFSAAQTDLQASSNKFRKVTTSVSATNNVITLASSFATGEANFAWAEWGVFNAASSGTMLSRKVEALGTKTSGTWVLTVTLTLAAS